MSFEKLLEELDVMAKSFDDAAKDDEKIKAAAAEGDADADGEHAEPDGDEDEEGNEPGQPMGKSFAFMLENGEQIEAMDGTELVKSLMDRVDATEGVMAKALGQAIGLIGKQGDRLNEQSELIKSLRADVTKLSGEGRGRKAVLSVAEKTAPGEQLAKSESAMTKQEFFAKANAAFDTGRITGKELTVIDVSLRSGSEIDQGLVSKVVG